MKVYIMNVRKLFILALFLGIFVILVSVSLLGIKTVGVFNSNKDLPIYFVDTKEKKVAITFDCAWGADDIPEILKTLKDENIKASFFIVGQWAEKYPDAVKMISADGHDIANHSYSHLRMGALDKESIKKDLNKCSDILKNLTGMEVDMFRPPYGDYSNNVVAAARESGLYTIQWNIDSLDWKPGISKEEILNRIKKRLVPGSIILFHNDTPHTASLLPEIIAEIKNNGYSFVPVSEMILRDNFYIDHEGKQKKKQ
ncbi:MAG TPA: polysaccharide deacetylase family protein [Clostridiaceae bacterium]|nr:polysaccharide deacetylase family protein [Clostridiaceae bacterium]